MNRDRLLPAGLMVLAVATLVTGATLIAARTPAPTPDRTDEQRLAAAEQVIRDFYALDDPDDALGRLVQAGLDLEGPNRDQLLAALARALASDVTIVGRALHTVGGVPIVAVEMSDGLVWCVRPDALILLGCRVADATLEVRVEGAPVVPAFAGLDLFASHLDLYVALTGQEPFTMTLPIELSTEDGSPTPFRLDEASYLVAGQRQPVPPGDVAFEIGSIVFLRYRYPDLDAAIAVLDRGPVAIAWDDARVTVRLVGLTPYLR